MGAHQGGIIHVFHVASTLADLPDLVCPVYWQQTNKGSSLGQVALFDPNVEWHETVPLKHDIYGLWRIPVGGKLVAEVGRTADGTEPVFLNILPGEVLHAMCG